MFTELKIFFKKISFFFRMLVKDLVKRLTSLELIKKLESHENLANGDLIKFNVIV